MCLPFSATRTRARDRVTVSKIRGGKEKAPCASPSAYRSSGVTEGGNSAGGSVRDVRGGWEIPRAPRSRPPPVKAKVKIPALLCRGRGVLRLGFRFRKDCIGAKT